MNRPQCAAYAPIEKNETERAPTRGGYPGSAPKTIPKRPEGPGASVNPPAFDDRVHVHLGDFTPAQVRARGFGAWYTGHEMNCHQHEAGHYPGDDEHDRRAWWPKT